MSRYFCHQTVIKASHNDKFELVVSTLRIESEVILFKYKNQNYVVQGHN